MGLNPWCAPIQIWQQVLGLAPPDAEESDALLWGKLLEHPIRLRYIEVTGSTVQVPAESIFHERHSWRRATPDGIVLHPRSKRWLKGLEIKTADAYALSEWGPEGTDEVPIQYVCQVAWSMHVLDLDEWDLAVLIGGRKFRIYRFKRDLELEARLVAQVDVFWREHVLPATPPEPDHTKAFRGYLERRYADVRDAMVFAEPEDDLLIERILHRRGMLAGLKREDATDCNALCARIGDAAGMVTASGKVHWKPSRPRRLTDWQAVARVAGSLHPDFEAIVAEHTRDAKEQRPLRLPRVADSSTPEESDD